MLRRLFINFISAFFCDNDFVTCELGNPSSQSNHVHNGISAIERIFTRPFDLSQNWKGAKLFSYPEWTYSTSMERRVIRVHTGWNGI